VRLPDEQAGDTCSRGRAEGLARRAPVAISGLGVVSALGVGAEALWLGLAAGRDGIAGIDRFSTREFSVHTAALVPGFSGTEAEFLALAFARQAAREAVDQARLGLEPASPHRVSLVLGTSLASHPEGIHRLAEILADELGALGPRLTLSTACASSANAIGLGRDLLLAGLADVVIAGGTDSLTPEIFAGFDALGLLAPDRCAPFSMPTGTTLGEGAGFVVLERRERAKGRGVAALALVSGSGLTCDAFHATSPDPTGGGVARAVRAALSDAGLEPADIDYVNMHGTGTEANDPAEWRAIETVFGDLAASLAVSATKSVFGHGQGAAGVLELAASLVAMARGSVPQTLHHTGARPRCPVDPVAQRTPRAHPVRHALCNSSAFGGANAVLAIDGADTPAAARVVRRRGVFAIGAGVIGPSGEGIDALGRALAEGRRAGRAAPVPLPRGIAAAESRAFDPISRLLAIAAAGAIRDAGLSLRGPMRDRVGLFGALGRNSPSSTDELNRSIKERGLARISAPAYTRVVLNASVGACARAHSLRGPTTTLTTGAGSALVALVLAAEHLSSRGDADTLLVASGDEIGEERPEAFFEGAACVALTAAPLRGPAVRIAGWGLAGPGRVEEAISAARAMAALGATPVEACAEPGLPAPAAAQLYRAAIAVCRLRVDRRAALLLADEGGGASAAVLFQPLDEEDDAGRA
jgi:3-oxoacyl-[acyl-carrier-protein] synthase II